MSVSKALVHLSLRQTDPFMRGSVYIGRAAYMHLAFTVNAPPLARGVTCYFGTCRNQTHISRVLLSCHRYKIVGQAATCKRSSLVVLFMAQYAHAATSGGERRRSV